MHILLCSIIPAAGLLEERLLVSEGAWQMCPPALLLKATALGAVSSVEFLGLRKHSEDRC
jgi:hypothetical protein